VRRDHFSASQINRFLSEPSLWVLDRLFGIRSEGGPNMWRGTAVEAGCDLALFAGADDDAAINVALQAFDREAQGLVDEQTDKARGEIPIYLKNLLPSMRELGMPLVKQARISINIDGIDAEIMGYVDYIYSLRLLDLKTTSRMPSVDGDGRIKDKWDHIRQMAIYERAKSLPPTLVYVTPGKPDKGKDHKPPMFYTPSRDELDTAMRQIEAGCRAMQRIIRASNNGRDPREIAELFPPRDFDGYMWDKTTRTIATEIWKL
jgi:hypothetical protein